MASPHEQIPGRHGVDLVRTRAMGRSLKRLLKVDPEPSTLQWQDIGKGLNVGDPLADDLVLWLDDVGMKRGLGLFREANDDPLSLGAATPEPIRALFASTAQMPSWLTWESIEHGVRVFHRSGRTAYDVLRNLALMGGYRAAGLNPPLLMTGALEAGTSRRIAQTMKWVIDCTVPGGLRVGGVGYHSTMHVRLVHALVRRQLAQRKEWDAALMGLPINQPDMAITYLGFSVMLLLGLRFMGMPLSDDDARGVMHLWSYACWLMGVDLQWLRSDEQEGRVLMYQLILSQMPPDASSERLGRALMENTSTLPFAAPRQLRQRLAMEMHLSTTRFFVGAQGMKELGLPANRLPWYPLATALPRMLWHRLHQLIPSGQSRLETRGRRTQESLLRLHFGGESPDLVSHVKADS